MSTTYSGADFIAKAKAGGVPESGLLASLAEVVDALNETAEAAGETDWSEMHVHGALLLISALGDGSATITETDDGFVVEGKGDHNLAMLLTVAVGILPVGLLACLADFCAFVKTSGHLVPEGKVYGA